MHLSIILDPRADVLHAENAAEMAALYHRLLTDAARAGERELKLCLLYTSSSMHAPLRRKRSACS